ncbi:uncharacterized protein LOC116655124 [Drosophila ananassae]|uniref:uncharacterized protein LOC116655124 n=1 Tax=Drosophila ananassae TaxID=7217 RepID=UPI000177ED14|nr:uncharacterized protein LOC116655124 [Drosophila ananassae]
MNSKTQNSADKRRQILAMSRAKDRAQIHHQNRYLEEELPEMEVEEDYQEHLDQRVIDLKERRAKVKRRGQEIQHYSVCRQAVEFSFRSETFKPPSRFLGLQDTLL